MQSMSSGEKRKTADKQKQSRAKRHRNQGPEHHQMIQREIINSQETRQTIDDKDDGQKVRVSGINIAPLSKEHSNKVQTTMLNSTAEKMDKIIF